MRRKVPAGARRQAAGLCVLLLVAAMIVAVAGSPSAASGAGYWHTCRPPSSLPIGTLRAHRVACAKGRRIITGFYAKAQAEGPDVVVDGFHCIGVVGGASCRHGAQRVRLEGSSERVELPSLAAARTESCPDAAALERPADPHGAIPSAKAALGAKGRVLEVRRGPGSTYAASAKRACGAEVLRDSAYVVVHPRGVTCSACNLHAYVVKFREGDWKVWTAY
jgi:hypothetical protein